MLDFTNNKDKLKCNYFSLKKKRIKNAYICQEHGKTDAHTLHY